MVEGRARRIDLEGADDLEALSVELRHCDNGTAATVLAGVGTLDGEHAWLLIDVLRRLGRPDDPGWVAQFDGAMAYADKQGWVDPVARSVRAHLTSSPPGSTERTP